MVLKLISKLLMTKQLQFDEGKIDVKGMKMNLLPSNSTSAFMKYFLETKELEKLYMLSWFWGHTVVYNISKKFGLEKPEEIYSMGMNFGEAMGFGLYCTHDYHPGEYTHFEIENNPFLESIDSEREEPIDYVISGIMGGGGCMVHEEVCQNVEIKCMNAGDELCEFLTGTKKELKSRGLWSIAKERYNLEKFLPVQKKIYDQYDGTNDSDLLDDLVTHLTD